MDDRTSIYFYYARDKELEKQLQPLYKLAEDNGFTVVDESKDANIIVSVGGDGAFLRAVRATGFRQDCLYTGLTRSDEAGLYCDFNIDHFDEMIDMINHAEKEVRRFPVIDVCVNGESTFQCLNEASVRSTIIKTIVMDVYIDNHYFETFRGDGLIVSTPTGSTGYSKSAGGAVIDPKTPCFQVTELASLNNNTYRTLGSSFILNQNRTLDIHVVQDGNDYPVVGLDNEAYSIQNIRSMKVSLGNKVIKTIKLKDNSFWDRVKRTFLDE
ncbi:NAD(+) kinase [Lentibacillus sp. JNUCC-1]|uniref:NAD kinase n=1 Tax=Lentibacillus sp. JNUCC-1 TaxID=2654513 RepID=UPI0012E9380A|nr:NAD kinase [Lentibacillus sp. JNUCC-1]MUV39314.1 NAD(+) kinase [Lentibacillus sp. JNUCC-1]